MEDAIVLYPSPAIGHLTPMVELGKLLLTHNCRLSTAPYINHVSATTSSITFHYLPAVSLPPNNSPHHKTLAFELLHLNNPNVHQAITSISKTSTVRALIMDFFCYPGLSVAADFNLPAYFFFTSAACSFAAFLYAPVMHRTITKSFKGLDTNCDIPGVPPMPSADMQKPLLNRSDKAYEGFLNSSTHMPKSAGIIVNTFESLEPRAIKAISAGLCVPDKELTPPLYCIGPLVAANNQAGSNDGSRSICSYLSYG